MPVTPLPDQTPAPNVEVPNAVNKFTVLLGKQIGFIVPVIVAGTNCSIAIVVVAVCEHPAPPYK